MSNTSTTSVTKCRARAYAYLTELIGSSPEALTWDATHRMQGHVHDHRSFRSRIGTGGR